MRDEEKKEKSAGLSSREIEKAIVELRTIHDRKCPYCGEGPHPICGSCGEDLSYLVSEGI